MRERDHRDTRVRALGLKVCAAIGGEAIAAHLSAQQLQQLVLHGRSGDAPADAAAMVSEAFWAFLIARQDRVCDVLAELRATEQRELYKPLLMQHIKETYEAVFGSSDEQMDGAFGPGRPDFRAALGAPRAVSREMRRELISHRWGCACGMWA